MSIHTSARAPAATCIGQGSHDGAASTGMRASGTEPSHVPAAGPEPLTHPSDSLAS
jgi:hypothetical protein